MSREEMIDSIAEHVMINTRGYKGRHEWPNEWDKTCEDSQISMVIEDIEEILLHLEGKFNYTFPKEGDQGVTTNTTVTVSTKENPSINDIKNFIERLEEIKVDETTFISGSLKIQLTFDNSGAYAISCGDCGEEDVLVETYSCKTLNDN